MTTSRSVASTAVVSPHGRWMLGDGRLVFALDGRDYFWEVPEDFAMPSPALLNLAEWLLLRSRGRTVPQTGSRSPGSKAAVAYSGGVDSTAALRLMPDAIPIYTRVANPGRLHKLENALLALDEVGGVAVTTNSDELAKDLGARRGFFGKGAWTIPSVLFADYYDLGVVADGDVLETVYLHSADGHGTRYATKDFSAVIARFEAAGLAYAMPCAGLTEVLTSEIASHSRYAMGCMRGEGGEPCLQCAKCYRKLALSGKPAPPNPEAEGRIEREVIPMLPSLLWAVQHRGLRHPILQSIDKDVTWAGRWYPDSLRHVPDALRPVLLRRLSALGVEAMTVADMTILTEWVSDRTPVRYEGRQSSRSSRVLGARVAPLVARLRSVLRSRALKPLRPLARRARRVVRR